MPRAPKRSADDRARRDRFRAALALETCPGLSGAGDCGRPFYHPERAPDGDTRMVYVGSNTPDYPLCEDCGRKLIDPFDNTLNWENRRRELLHEQAKEAAR